MPRLFEAVNPKKLTQIPITDKYGRSLEHFMKTHGDGRFLVTSIGDQLSVAVAFPVEVKKEMPDQLDKSESIEKGEKKDADVSRIQKGTGGERKVPRPIETRRDKRKK